MLSQIAQIMDRKSSNRALTRLRALLRSNEFYLIPLALVVGVVTGAIVTLMSQIAQIAHVLIYGIPIDVRLSANAYVNPVTALIAPAAGGLLLGLMEWLRRRWKIASAVDPIEANALRGGRLSLRDSIVVSGQTLVSNGCGASVGLEAGYTQIGSGAASLLGQVLNLRRNDLRLVVGCGAAAAIAAAFGAPITGAFYACELIVGVYSVGSAAPILAASLSGALTAQYLGGAPYSLEVPHVNSVGLEQYLALIVLALIAAMIGIAVMRSSVGFERVFANRRIPVWLRPVIGGVCVGGLAIVTPQVLAAGHGAMVLNLHRDMAMIAEALDQPLLELVPARLHLVEQVVVADDPLHLERGGAGERMREIGVPVLERSGAGADGLDDLAAREHGADRLVAAAESLGDRLDIGCDALLLPRMQRAGAAHAAHDLVQDQERAVTIADFAHRSEIALGRRHAAGSGADHRFGDEGRNRVGTKPQEFGFEFVGKARDELGIALVVALFVIGKGRRHVGEGRRQQCGIGLAPPGVSAGRERAQGVAVVALPARDEVAALVLAALHEILPRQFDARLDRFRSATDEIGVSEPARLMADELLGKRLRRLGGKEGGMGESEPGGLPCNRIQHARMLVAEAGHCGAAGGVEHAMAVLADQPDAFAADGERRRLTQASVQDAAFSICHDRTCPGTIWRGGMWRNRESAARAAWLQIAAHRRCRVIAAGLRRRAISRLDSLNSR